MATVTLDRERDLRYEWGAIKRLKQEQGLSFLEVVDEQDWWFDPVKFSAMLWCGLITEDPDLTVEQVDAEIRLSRLGMLTRAMVEAANDACVEGEQGANPPTPSTA